METDGDEVAAEVKHERNLNENPNFVQCMFDIYEGFSIYLKKNEEHNKSFSVDRFVNEFVSDVGKYFSVSTGEICLVICLGIVFTILRYSLSRCLFTPLTRYLQLTRTNAEKFPESMWKVMYYAAICGYTFYLLIYPGKYDFFRKPYNMWSDWYEQTSVPVDIGIAYAMEFSWYLHSVYGTLYMDHWRKDSIIMVFHHFLCLVLIGFSYAVKYHKVGLLLMFVHDFADICLEGTKCQVYLKIRGGCYYWFHDVASTVGFVCFTIAWFVGRLYWYPIKVLRSAGYITVSDGPEPALPFYLVFNVMLWLMFALNVYWFLFILNFLFKVATGQVQGVDDIREYDVEDKMKNGVAAKQTAANGTSTVIGDSVSNGANGMQSASYPNGCKSHLKAKRKDE